MTLLELLQLLRRHLALCIVLPVAFLAVAAVYCWGFMPNVYTAQTSIYALTTGLESADKNANVTYSDISASQQLANDFAELADNEQIQLAAAQRIGLEDLKGYDIEVQSSTTNRVIKLDVTGQDPKSCAVIANALAKEIGDTAVEVMGVKAVNVISKAIAPDKPSGPKRTMYAAVAFLAGLFVAIALVVLMDMLNTRIRNDREAEELLGLPVIGRFPYVKGGK